MPEADDDEAVRIFVEFERMESAIKGEKRTLLFFDLNFIWLKQQI